MGATRDDALALRLAGRSTAQIAAALGMRPGRRLREWLRDVPPPPWTARPNAKDDVRDRALALRAEGKSYREIREALGVSKSTLSLWLRDVPLSEEQRAALGARRASAAARRAATNRTQGARRRQNVVDKARAEIGGLGEPELFVAGIVAYWAEGSKNKPWRSGHPVHFLNSDADLIRLFLSWLRLVGVDEERLCYRVSIHESADVAAAEAFWADVVGVPASAFDPATLKRHNPKTVRKNVGDGYHGCLGIRVRRSADLNLQIEGWFRGVAAAAGPALARR